MAWPQDSSERFTFSRVKHVEVDGKFADAVLGNAIGDREEFIVAVEGKGPLDPLDRPFKNWKMSVVDQDYRYAINLPCDWIINAETELDVRVIQLFNFTFDEITML